MIRFGIAMVALCVAGASSASANETRAVVELFTSQGCSSCPPADKLASELARDPANVVVSMPVDYWDYLGWKDTLAKPAFTHRQKAYAAARGDRNIYTPQIVVNGVAHVVGSDASSLKVAERETRQSDGRILAADVKIKPTGSGFQIDIGGVEGASGEVWLFSTSSRADVDIGRGENTGRHVEYTNVVRAMTKLGDYTGQPMAMPVSKEAAITGDADGFVVLVQAIRDGNPSTILGAAAHSPLH